MKYSLFIFFFAFFIPIIILHPSYAEIEHSTNKTMSDLMENENRYIFLTNQRGQDFNFNFGDAVKLNQADSSIIIKSGTTVVLDESPKQNYETILVEGELRITNTENIPLRVQKIIVGPSGLLTIGNNQNPVNDENTVEIVFEKMNDGEIGIFVFGQLQIHGEDIGRSFTELKTSAMPGDKRIVVKETLNNWEAGKNILLTSPGQNDCNEQVETSRIDSFFISFNTPLKCFHQGSDNANEKFSSHLILIDRNVKFSSVDGANRGSVNFFHGSSGYIKFAHFDNLGPKDVLGRYPIHFHHMKDTSRGIEVIGNSITNSENRWITIHDSNGVIVRNNFGYNAVGHGFFLEDGNEFDNIFEKNIGVLTVPGNILLSDKGASVFWSINPMNSYMENVAVDGYYGFRFDIADEEVFVPFLNQNLNFRSLPSLEFEDNTAYNYRAGGIRIARPVIPQENIETSEIIVSNFKAMNSFQDGVHGIVLVGSNVTVLDSTLINNQIGISLGGEKFKIFNTEINVWPNKNSEKLVTGILINGKNNHIENTKIQGYVSKNNRLVSDISISNNENQKGILSAKIINSTLMDQLPIYFGEPQNDDSFLVIYGFNAPHYLKNNLPNNFILKKIGTEQIEARGEGNNVDFNAIVKIVSEPFSEFNGMPNMMLQEQMEDMTKNEIIKSFKNKAFAWKNDLITTEKLLNEIEILFESRIIEISGVEENTFENHNFNMPNWIKNLVKFWFDGSISNTEFFNAIEFILESQLNTNVLKYD